MISDHAMLLFYFHSTGVVWILFRWRVSLNSVRACAKADSILIEYT